MKQRKDYQEDAKSDPSGFRQKARKHQSNYRSDKLQVDFEDDYGTRLNEADGFQRGLNFYKELGVWAAVQAKFKKFKEQLHSNLLRSEHIPFNFFIPIDKYKQEQKTIDFLNTFVPDLDAVSIDKFQIEFAPPVRKSFLNDNTSFDTYIQTTDKNKLKTGIGIEVKYTERSYPYGKTEYDRMFDAKNASVYHQASAFAGVTSEAIILLREKDLKQFWRNYLLGVAMVREHELDKFVSVQLYPQGNVYQAEHAKAFKELLPEDNRFRFMPVTFEAFIEKGKIIWHNDEQRRKWLEYLEERYIVKE